MDAATVTGSPARKLESVERPRAGETYGEPPPPSAPRYTHGCHHQKNYLALWRKPGAGGIAPGGQPIVRVPHRCGSWRHEGPCARFAAARDFARIKSALQREDPRSVVYFVLTLDRSRPELRSGSRWELFESLGDLQSKLLKRLNRLAEKTGGDPIGSRWVACVEQHRDGWPHVNLVCVSSWLAARVRATADAHREAGVPRNEIALVGGDIRKHVEGSGFGSRSTAEGARSLGAVAGYLVKLAGAIEANAPELCDDARAVAEVAKIAQAPTAAPKGFRRLRSGVRFLPPRNKPAGRWTGVLATWSGRVLGRSKPGARPEVALDLEAGRVYRSDRLPILVARDGPSRTYAITPRPIVRQGETLVGKSLDVARGRAVDLLRLGSDASKARARSTATRAQAPPDRPRHLTLVAEP